MKKHLKYIIPATLVLIVVVVLVVLAKVLPASEEKADTVNIVVPDGAPLIPFSGFATADTNSKAEDGVLKLSSDYTAQLGKITEVHIVSGPDQLAASIKNEQPEIAVVPINLAAKLYNEEHQYRFLAITTWGLNEIVGQTKLNSLEDLRGKTLYSFGKSETPGIVLRTLLDKASVSYSETELNDAAQGLKIVEVSTAQDVVAALTKESNGNNAANAFGLLPEPVASAFKAKMVGKYDVAYDLQEAWKTNFDNVQYPQAGIVIRNDFLESKENTKFVYTLLGALTTSAYMAKADPATAIKILTENLGSTMFSAAEPSSDAIKSGRLDFHFGETYEISNQAGDYTLNRKIIHDYLETIANFSDTSKQMIGGAIPDDDFYAKLTLDAAK